uniref:Uncharacterized protein n=1 Tax=uncultured Rhodospirillales bacterium HF0200_01O14 TaxID=710787 RepID=E0XTX2_9PROT|nr:hypothetical protein [uncultured Rhodospirillales bacterium HF0200_01O14]
MAREYLRGKYAQGNILWVKLLRIDPLAGHKSETYICFRAKILRKGISVPFLPKRYLQVWLGAL